MREKEEELDAADREAEVQERAAKLQRGESTQGEKDNCIPLFILEVCRVLKQDGELGPGENPRYQD